jgi:hypothetical protein
MATQETTQAQGWDDKVEKWRYGIKPDEVDNSKLREYAYAKRY